MRNLLILFLAAMMFAGDKEIPEADQAAYWKELATFQFLNRQLAETLKSANEISQNIARQQVKVDTAQKKLEAGCGKDKMLDPLKFQQSELVCIQKPKEK